MRANIFLLPTILFFAGCAAEPDEVHIQDIHGLAVDPEDPHRLYVATHHGLFVGEGERKWSAVTKEPFDMMGFTMHPTDASVMYASGHPASYGGKDWAVGVVKSTDGGRTWTTLALKNEVDFHAMAMQPGPEGRDGVYGFHGGKFHTSVDGGVTWTSAPVSFEVSSLAVDRRDGGVYAATDAGVQRRGPRAEGGWSLLAPGEALAVAVAADGGLLAYFVDGGLKRSSDSGATWAPMNWTVPDRDYPWAIAPGHEGGVTYVGTLKGRIFKTANAGESWATLR